MIRRTVILLVFCFSCTVLQAQPWRSVLYPENGTTPGAADFYTDKIIQDFSYAGYHRGEIEVPVIAGYMVDVTKAPYKADNTGTRDVTAILQRAIDETGSRKKGGVVYLPEGTYQVHADSTKKYCLQIDHANLVLRGAGAGKTFLYNVSTAMRGKSIVQISGGKSWAMEGQNKQLITMDLMAATTIIPVATVAGFAKGDLVMIRNYINNDWIAEHKMMEHWKDKSASLGGQFYSREIVEIRPRSNELVIDIPTRYALKQAHGAAVYKSLPMLSEVGVEHLSIGNKQSFEKGNWTEESYNNISNPTYQLHDCWAIDMENVSNSWIRDVSSYCPAGNTSGAHLLSNGIKIYQAKNVSLLKCDFKKPQYGGGGGNGYMYRIMANETLVQDCIAEFCRHGYVLAHMEASGNVFHRCLDKDAGKQTGLTGNEKTSGSGSDHHMHFSHSNLFDQCRVENSYFAAGWRKWGGSTIHGLTAAHSVYWNLTSNGSQNYSVETQQGRYGYVIGTSGNKPAVSTSAWMAGTASITDPVDFTEGLGKGEDLQPQSLYLDQKSRRKVNVKK